MKTLELKLGDKVYTTSRIVARLTREAFALNKDSLHVARMAKNMDKNDLDGMDLMLQDMADIAVRKDNLICEVYGDKFTADEVRDNLTDQEINEQIEKIVKGITGVVQKN